MKNKPLIITIAIGILLLALGSWLYLFLFGTPQSSGEVFTDLGIVPSGEQTVNPATTQPTEPEETTVDTKSDQELHQLTLRPVAGYVATADTVRYVERGTGHVYEINVNSGSEERISNTTVPLVTDAHFSDSGEHVVLVGKQANQRQVTVGRIANGSLETNPLPPTAQNIAVLGTSTVRYTLSDRRSTVGYDYDIASNSQQELFRIPLSAVAVSYAKDSIQITNKPAVELEGSIFTITNGQLTPIGVTAFGLTSLFGTNWYALTFNSNDEIISRAVRWDGSQSFTLPITVIPEKCVWQSGLLYCAAPLAVASHTFLEDWYKGITRSNDALWRVNPLTESASLLANPSTDVGRPLDMDMVSITTTNNILFTNRLDSTLWMYEEATD